MSIVSFKFLLFLWISIIIYYSCPKKKRWLTLLVFSVLFFLFSCSWKLIFYFLFGILITYGGTHILTRLCKTEKQKKIVLAITLGLLIGILFVLKYINIFPMTFNMFGSLFHLDLWFEKFYFLAPLGVSYYTLSLTGYIIDVYRGAYSPEKNILKLALFGCYYPIMVSGPIVRYQTMKEELFEPKEFQYQNIFMGFERIIYGLMKKLVIADQLASFVNMIFANYTYFNSYYIIIGVILYAIQIYMDFSGCMDIVIGASKMYGITLMENFDSPFFSKNLSEFWRRWHISLGTWAKDYIMYPLLKSSLFQKLGKNCKQKFGKKIGKSIPTILAIFILWLLIGLWHGASYKYIFAAGILPWIYLTLSQIFEKPIEKITEKLKIRTDCFSFRLFQSIRTFLLMCFLWLFVCSPTLSSTMHVIKNIFVLPNFNLIYELPKLPSVTLILMGNLVLIVDYLKYKGIPVWEKFQEQNIWFRWLIIFILIIVILTYGTYGPGYNPSDFIYGGF